MARVADVLKLRKMFGLDPKEASDLLDNCNGDLDLAIEKLGDSIDTKAETKMKEPKSRKLFKVGDIVKCIDPSPDKLPPDCVQFLNTYNSFKVKDVNESLKIDLGYRLESNGHQYFFAPHRFELKNGKAPLVDKNGKIIPEFVKVEPAPMPEIKKNIFDEDKKKIKYNYDEEKNKFKWFKDFKDFGEDERKREFQNQNRNKKIMPVPWFDDNEDNNDIGGMGDDTKFEVYPKYESDIEKSPSYGT